MLTFIDSIDKLDQDAPEGDYYVILITVVGMNSKVLTLNDGENEFELEFTPLGDIPEVGQHYYMMLDVSRA